jgi:hypothetical protein
MRAIVPEHKVRQNVPTGAAHGMREGVARVIKVPTSDDIWHLSIEDLLAPPGEPTRTAGEGPFVINLRTSTTTIGSPPKGLLPFDRLHVYQLMRTHEGRPQFQLRLGIIESELQADTLLSMVREHYPGAIKERAEDDDKAAIARAACPAESAKPAAAVADTKAPVVQVPKKIAPPAARPAAAKPAEHRLLDIDELLAEDDDKAATARAACPAEPAKPAGAVADTKAPVVQVSKKIAPPAARQAAAKPAEHSRWDIDELLPELAAVRPPGREPTPSTRAASKGERKPPKLTTPRRSAKTQTQHSAAAPRARPGAQSRPTPPSEETRQSQPSRGVTKPSPDKRGKPLSVAANPVMSEPRAPVSPGQPLAKTAQLSVDVSYSVSQAARAPTSAVVEEIDSDPNAITDRVELLTPGIERQIAAATEARLPPGSGGGTESSIERKFLDVPRLEPARPEPDLRRLDPATATEPELVITADSPAGDSVHAEPCAATASPVPAADAHANLPVASGEHSTADSGTLERVVAKIGALIDSAETHQKSAIALQSNADAFVEPAPPSSSHELIAPEPVSPIPTPHIAQSASAQASAPLMDSTQTVRALTPLELADGEASRWFAIQLMLREEPIEPEQVPMLGIFSEYRLYSVTGLEQDRLMHALRVGFFSSELAAEAVAGYLVTYFDSPVIKRVSIAERERFADSGLAARKDVGASGVHAVIELATPAPLAERRAAERRVAERRVAERHVAERHVAERRVAERRVDAAPSDSNKRAAFEATSLWSRLLRPRTR